MSQHARSTAAEMRINAPAPASFGARRLEVSAKAFPPAPRRQHVHAQNKLAEAIGDHLGDRRDIGVGSGQPRALDFHRRCAGGPTILALGTNRLFNGRVRPRPGDAEFDIAAGAMTWPGSHDEWWRQSPAAPAAVKPCAMAFRAQNYVAADGEARDRRVLHRGSEDHAAHRQHRRPLSPGRSSAHRRLGRAAAAGAIGSRRDGLSRPRRAKPVCAVTPTRCCPSLTRFRACRR